MDEGTHESDAREEIRAFQEEKTAWPWLLRIASRIRFLTANKMINPDYSQADRERMRNDLEAWRERLGIGDPAPFESILDEYARADRLSCKYQNYFRLANILMYMLAVAAIAVVAVQTLFFHAHPWIVWFEVAALVGTILLLRRESRKSWHLKWINYRYLAERFRGAFYLVLAGKETCRPESGDPSRIPPWPGIYFEGFLENLEAVPVPGADGKVEELRTFILEHWIRPQLAYHESNIEKKEHEDHRLHRLGIVLFGITIVAAVLHATHLVERIAHEAHAHVSFFGHASHEQPFTFGNLLTAVALVFPAMGASLNAIRMQFDYGRVVQDSATALQTLGPLSAKLEKADTLEEIRNRLREIQEAMMTENKQWYRATALRKLALPG